MNFKEDPRPLLVFDWSAQVLDVTTDGEVVTQMKNIETLADSLNEPHKIVCESSFEPYVLGRRQGMAKLLRERGHELYTFNQRQTARRRRELELDKSNDNDARVIFDIAANTNMHMHPLLPDPDEEWIERRSKLNREYLHIKFNGQKPELLIKPAKAILGRFSKRTEEEQEMWGNGKPDKYSDSVLAAVYFTTARTRSRDEFERLLGLYQAGYPTLLRSDIHKHGYGSGGRKRGLPVSKFRHGVRLLRAEFLAAGVDDSCARS